MNTKTLILLSLLAGALLAWRKTRDPNPFRGGGVATSSGSCATYPLRNTGTTRYFCDCQTGAQSGCVAGSDANAGTSASAPKQTWAAALSAFSTMNAGDTIALCSGGSWIVASGNDCSNQLSNTSCAAGTSLTDPLNTSTCDIRDYGPAWGGTAQPLVQASSADASARIFGRFGGPNLNGLRILNIHFHGGNAGPRGGTYQDHRAMMIAGFNCTGTAANDSGWLVCGNTFDNFRVAWQGPQNDQLSNARVTNNVFNMNDLDAILGFGSGSNNQIDNNTFDNNGGFVHPITGNEAHAVYLTPLNGTGTAVATNTSLTNNNFTRSGAAGTPGICATGALVAHGQFNGLTVEGNVVNNVASSNGVCEGIHYSAAGSDNTYFRNAVFRRNLIIQGSGVGISIGQAPGVIIENNIVSLTGTSDTWKQGIWAPRDTARSGLDDVGNNTTIRNNTIYSSGTSFAGQYGVYASGEGTGHVIANNSVYSDSGRCFATLLGTCTVGATVCVVDNSIGDSGVPACSGTCNPNAAAYTAVTRNACFGGATPFYYNAPGSDFDPGTELASNPLFVNVSSPPSGFKPGNGSPLIGAGSAANGATVDYATASRPNPPSIGAYEP